MENPIKLDDLGVPPFGETCISEHGQHMITIVACSLPPSRRLESSSSPFRLGVFPLFPSISVVKD